MLGTAAEYEWMYGGVWPDSLANQMMDTWIAFARTGCPDNPGLPSWPPYDTTLRPTMVFDADGDTPTTHVENNPEAARREFWSTIPFDGLRPAFKPAALGLPAGYN